MSPIGFSSSPPLEDMATQALARDSAEAALEYNGRAYTWGEMCELAKSLAAALAASGVAKRQPIGFVPRNRPSAVAALLTLLANGYSIQMIYAFQAKPSLAQNIERLMPAVVVGERLDLEGVVSDTLRVHGIAGIALNEMDAAAIPGLEFTRVRPQPTDPEGPEIQILTSGTTGAPKQHPLPYALFQRYIASSTASASGLRHSRTVPTLLSFPMGNIAGMYTVLPTMLAGRPAILVDRFTIQVWHAWVLRYRPEHAGLPPAGVQMILDANYPREDLASIRYMSTGAAPLDPTVHRAFEDYYGIPILLSYGATEFGGPVVAMSPELHAQFGTAKLGSVGRAMPGVRIRVVDPTSGEELPAGAEGLLEVVSPRMGAHWIRTSDIAVIDVDGFVFHRGRADGAIMRGGFKVLPETIERALLLHPAIAVAAVIGVPDHRLGQIPAAAVQIKVGLRRPEPAELEAHLRNHVLSTHIPVYWKIVNDMPRTPSLKIDRPGVERLFNNNA